MEDWLENISSTINAEVKYEAVRMIEEGDEVMHVRTWNAIPKECMVAVGERLAEELDAMARANRHAQNAGEGVFSAAYSQWEAVVVFLLRDGGLFRHNRERRSELFRRLDVLKRSDDE